jgi:hypothetical protein
MSYKSVTLLIDEARTSAEEKDFSATTGITEDEVLRHLNQGKNIIYRKLINMSQNLFTKVKEVSLEAGQKTVVLPFDIYGKNRILDVKVLEGQVVYQVKAASEKHDIFSELGRPQKYYRMSNSIQLIPANSSFNSRVLKLSYVAALPKLSKQAAKVLSLTITDGVITDFLLDTSIIIESNELNKYTSISVCDRNGNIKAYDIPFDNIDSATGIVTVTSGFVLPTDEIIEAGDVVVSGPFSSTHTGLEIDVEEYCIEYAIFKMLQRQGSAEVATQAQLVIQLENSIMETYSNISDDVVSPLVQGFRSDGWL